MRKSIAALVLVAFLALGLLYTAMTLADAFATQCFSHIDVVL